MVLGLVTGCGPGVAGPPGVDGSGSGNGTMATEAGSADGPSTVDDTGTGPDPTGSSDSGEVDGCLPPAELTGELLWSIQEATDDPLFHPAAADVALDGSGAGGFYLARDCVLRLDTEGVEQWSADGGGCIALAVDPQGNPVVAGWVPLGMGDEYDPTRVTKLDAAGDVLWTFERDVPGTVELATDLAVDPAGNVVVVGRATSNGGTGPGWIAALDPAGNTLWTQALPGMFSSGPEVGIDAASNIYTAGTLAGVGSTVLVIALDDQGAQRWTWETDGPDAQHFELYAMAVSPAGEVAVTGNGTPPNFPFPPLVELTLLDAQGDELWSHNDLQRDGSWLQRAEAIAFDPCGAIVLAGSGDPAGSSGQLWLAKASMAGTLLWAQYIDGGYTSIEFGDGDDRLYGVAIDEQGSAVVTGVVVVDKVLAGDTVMDVREQWLGRFAP